MWTSEHKIEQLILKRHVVNRTREIQEILFRSSGSSSRESDEERTLSDKFYLRRKRITPASARQWSLAAKRELESGEFLGLYSGNFQKDNASSRYALEILNDISVFPFENEANISYRERELHPFSNMNEPDNGTAANCIMFVVDFSADEIEKVETIPNYEKAYYFKGIVCLTCAKVNMHDELTWHYGPAYEAHRKAQNYIAGSPCKFKLKEEDFAKFNPVPAAHVYPVFMPVPSPRFGTFDSSSEEEYMPPRESRKERLQRRQST